MYEKTKEITERDMQSGLEKYNKHIFPEKLNYSLQLL